MVSVVIPTLDEEKRLPACLDALLVQAALVRTEVIVVDGGSADSTSSIARARVGVKVLSARRGRGSQMNAGARASSGSLLVFLPADTLLPPTALAALASIDRVGRPRAGGFQQRFDADRPMLRLVSSLHNRRAAWTGVFYGDQVPFVRRDLFWQVGGFREDTDLEDVEFGQRLARHTRPEQLDLVVATSARRFERHGPLRATLEAARILGAWSLSRRVPRSETFFTAVR